VLFVGPPVLGAILAGVLVGVARKVAREPQAPVTDFVVLLSIAGASAIGLARYFAGVARVRRGSPTPFPRLWRALPWTAMGGFLVGLIAAGAHALSK
jgi:hypothetical protein